MNWTNAVLALVRGLGQQRVAARLGNQRTQVGGNVCGLPISVAGMRPSKTCAIICFYSLTTLRKSLSTLAIALSILQGGVAGD